MSSPCWVYCLFVLFWTPFALAGCKNEFGTWTKGAAIPQFHQEGQPTTVVGTKLYIAGAFGTNDLLPTDRISVYDISTDTWTTSSARTPFNSSHVNSAFDGRYIYMIAGFSGKHPGTATKVAFRFDVVTEKFETLPDLPDVRASAAVIYDPINKRVHYIGGLVDRNKDSDKHWSLDVTAPLNAMNWTEEAAFPEARNHLTGVYMNGLMYLPGGQFGHDNNPQDQPIVHSYNATSKRFEKLPDMPTSRSHAEPGTVEINGRLVIFGGREKSFPVHDDFIEFNPVTKTWEYIGKLPDGRWINPSVGFFPNVTRANTTKPSNWVVITAGGKQYDDSRSELFIAEVTFNCTDTKQSPPVTFWGETAAPEAAPTDPPTDETTPEPALAPQPSQRNNPTAPPPSPLAALSPPSSSTTERGPLISFISSLALILLFSFMISR